MARIPITAAQHPPPVGEGRLGCRLQPGLSMKKRGLLMLCALFLMLATMVPCAYAADDPVACAIEISPEFLVGPGEVKVTITVSNTTNKDLQDPVVLFSPEAEKIADFGDNGEVTLKAGESKTWSGTYSVNERELEQGYIQYFAKYTVYQNNGQAKPNSQSIRATIKKIEAEVGIDVDRTIAPPAAHEGQEVQVKYAITNSGTVALTDVTITESKDINSKAQTIPKLEPGAKVELTYKATMKKKDLVSSAEITYKADGNKKKQTYTVEEKKIPFAQADLQATLSSDVKGVVSGGTVKLTLELKNKGSVDMSDIRVTDPILGDVFTNQKVEAGKTLTLEKEVTLTESCEYQFAINAIDSTGTEISAASNALPLTAMDPDEALNLTLTATPDRTEVYDEPAAVRFKLTVTNDSRVDATDVKISHGFVELYTFDSIPAGESRTMSRDTVLSTSGKYQFTAVAKDPLDNESTFQSNEMQIAVYQPTPVPATPTLPPEPTPEPTFVPVTVVPIHHESIGTLPKAVQSVLLPALIAAGVLLLGSGTLLLVAAKKRHDNKKASEAAYDHLERTRRRDYITANPDELAASSKETLSKNQRAEEDPEPDAVISTDDGWELPPFEGDPVQEDTQSDARSYSSFGQGFYGEVEADGFEPATPQADQNVFYAYDDLAEETSVEQQPEPEQSDYGYGSSSVSDSGEQWQPADYEAAVENHWQQNTYQAEGDYQQQFENTDDMSIGSDQPYTYAQTDAEPMNDPYAAYQQPDGYQQWQQSYDGQPVGDEQPYAYPQTNAEPADDPYAAYQQPDGYQQWQQSYDEQPLDGEQGYGYQQDGYMNTYDGFEPIVQDAAPAHEPSATAKPAKKGLFGRKRK